MLRRLFLEHGRPHLKSYVLAGLFMAIGAAATSVSAWLLKPVLNRMVDPAGFADLRWLAVGVAGLFAAARDWPRMAIRSCCRGPATASSRASSGAYTSTCCGRTCGSSRIGTPASS